jgi:hypothetical protein
MFPQRASAEAVITRVPNEQEDFLARRDAGLQDQRLPVQFVDERVLKLHESRDRLGDGVTVAGPRYAEEFGDNPFPGVYYKHAVHVVGRVCWRDVDRATGGAELVDETNRTAKVLTISLRDLVRPFVFSVFYLLA